MSRYPLSRTWAWTCVLIFAALLLFLSQRTSGGGGGPVSATITLQNGLLYMLSPPQAPDLVQDLRSAADLEALLQGIDPDLELFAARTVPLGPDGVELAFECYPATGSRVFEGQLFAFCWSFTDDLRFREREGIWVRVDTGGAPPAVTFDWQGVELNDPAVYDLSVGLNHIAVPYGPVPAPPVDAADLIDELGPLDTPFVSRFLSFQNAFEAYTGTSGTPFAITPGESYFAQRLTGPPPGGPRPRRNRSCS